MEGGFSTIDITPPLGSEVPGGFRKNFLWDVHDPLHIKAAVFENNGVRVALVGVDSLSLKASTVSAGRLKAEKISGIPSNHIMVAATHTHRGGPTVDWAGDPEKLLAHSSNPEFIRKLLKTTPTADQNYLHFLSRQIGSAVALADKHKVEAECAVGIGKESSVSFNRRFKMKNGRQMTHPGKGNPDILEPAGPFDPDVGVLSVWDMDGRFLGCVVNFACHGTTMELSSGYSADWPYYLDRTIRGVMDEDSTVVFINGACGDVTQVDNKSIRELEFGEKWARRVGQKVGAESLKIIAEAEPGDPENLDAGQITLRLEKRKIPGERLKRSYDLVKSNTPKSNYRWLFARDIILLNELNKIEPMVPCEIQAIQIGPSVFVSSPAELFCQLGLDIKSTSPFPNTFIAELANGCIGYVPTEKAMGSSGGGYETRTGLHSFLVPSAGKRIAETSIDLIKKFTPGQMRKVSKVEKIDRPWNIGAAFEHGD